MARSSCVRCGGGSFEMKTAEPRDAAYKQLFVQCTSCGGVAGVVSVYDPGILAKAIQKEVADLKKSVQRIDHQLGQVAYKLRT
jgi:hypothetical protein